MMYLKANWLLISNYAGVIPTFLPVAVCSAAGSFLPHFGQLLVPEESDFFGV
jgi:hypothetical protein